MKNWRLDQLTANVDPHPSVMQTAVITNLIVVANCTNQTTVDCMIPFLEKIGQVATVLSEDHRTLNSAWYVEIKNTINYPQSHNFWVISWFRYRVSDKYHLICFITTNQFIWLHFIKVIFRERGIRTLFERAFIIFKMTSYLPKLESMEK